MPGRRCLDFAAAERADDLSLEYRSAPKPRFVKDPATGTWTCKYRYVPLDENACLRFGGVDRETDENTDAIGAAGVIRALLTVGWPTHDITRRWLVVTSQYQQIPAHPGGDAAIQLSADELALLTTTATERAGAAVQRLLSWMRAMPLACLAVLRAVPSNVVSITAPPTGAMPVTTQLAAIAALQVCRHKSWYATIDVDSLHGLPDAFVAALKENEAGSQQHQSLTRSWHHSMKHVVTQKRVSLQLLNGHSPAAVEAMIREANSQDGTPAAFLWRPADDTLEAANESIDTLVRACTSDAAHPFNVDDPDRSVMRPHCLRMSHHSDAMLAPSSPPSVFLLVLCLPSAALQQSANEAITSLLYYPRKQLQPTALSPIEYFDWQLGLWVTSFEGYCWNPQHTYDVVTDTYTSTPTAPDPPFSAIVRRLDMETMSMMNIPTVVNLVMHGRDGPTAVDMPCGGELRRHFHTSRDDVIVRSAAVALEPLAAALTVHSSVLHRVPTEVLEVHVLPFLTTHDAIFSLRCCNKSTKMAFEALDRWVNAPTVLRTVIPWRRADLPFKHRGPLDAFFHRVPDAVVECLKKDSNSKWTPVVQENLKTSAAWPRHKLPLPQLSECFIVNSQVMDDDDDYGYYSSVEVFTTELIGPMCPVEFCREKYQKQVAEHHIVPPKGKITLPGHPEMATAPLAQLGGARGVFCSWSNFSHYPAYTDEWVPATYYLGPLETAPAKASGIRGMLGALFGNR